MSTAAIGRDVVWLSWLNHQRTRGLADYFGHDVMVWESRRPGTIRHLELFMRSAAWLIRARPRVVIVQCPSIVLAHLALVLRPLLGFRVCLDAHNEIIQNFNFSSSMLMRRLYDIALRNSELVIVTNPTLAGAVAEKGGRPFVLPDRITPREAVPEPALSSPVRVCVISTFARDEPLDEILEAARILGPTYHFTVTGRINEIARELALEKPGNVTFCGFLAEGDYWSLLQDSSLVVDLTKKPACLVCGAYEAAALRRPMVLTTDFEAQAWFGKAAVYTTNDARDIAKHVASIAQAFSVVCSEQRVALSGIQSRWEELAKGFERAVT